MTIEQLQAVYNAQPFRPFDLHLADGRSIPVQHRDFIMRVPRGRTIVVAEPNGRLHILDFLLITDRNRSCAGQRLAETPPLGFV